MIMEQITSEIIIPNLAWAFGVLGWIIYNLYLLDESSKEFDKDEDGLSGSEVKKYLKKTWVGILMSFLLIPVGVISMPMLWNWFAPDKGFHISAYFLVGLMAIGLQRLIKKLRA